MLHKRMGDVSPGQWGVGVSGGADSVALLLLLAGRPELGLHVIHLDHQTRGGESGEDAAFVRDLAGRLRLPCTIKKRSAVEAGVKSLPRNVSSRYRRARLTLFAKVVTEHQLRGVLLAHHADDQAETVLLRMLRGGGPANLAGIREESVVGALRIVRPLLGMRGEELRDYLRERGHAWREDASNQSREYSRNRLRQWLAGRGKLTEELLKLQSASRAVRNWLDESAPVLGESFSIQAVNDLPMPVARHAVARWLMERGAPPVQINSQTCQRLVQMCGDAAVPGRQHFPGGILVRRHRGTISGEIISVGITSVDRE